MINKIKDFVEDFSNFFKLYNKTKKNEVELELNKHDIFVDWIGRPYYIIKDIPTEFLNDKSSLDYYITQQLVLNVNPIFSKLNLSDIVFPDIKVVNDTYLVLFNPLSDFVNLSYWRVFFLKLIFYPIIIFLIYTLCLYLINVWKN